VLGWRCVFLVALSLCVGCAPDPGSLPDTPPPPAPWTGDRDIIGCYERGVPARTLRPGNAAVWELPPTFYLSPELQGLASLEGKTVPLWWIRQGKDYRASGHWKVIGPNTISIAWSTGFQGVEATLRRASTDDMWRGWSVPFADDGTAPARLGVTVRRVSDAHCDFPH
jgi:hypothetical protein